ELRPSQALLTRIPTISVLPAAESGKPRTEHKLGIRFSTRSGSHPSARWRLLLPIPMFYMSEPGNRRGAMASIARRMQAPPGRTWNWKTYLSYKQSLWIRRMPTSPSPAEIRLALESSGALYRRPQERPTEEFFEP